MANQMDFSPAGFQLLCLEQQLRNNRHEVARMERELQVMRDNLSTAKLYRAKLLTEIVIVKAQVSDAEQAFIYQDHELYDERGYGVSCPIIQASTAAILAVVTCSATISPQETKA